MNEKSDEVRIIVAFGDIHSFTSYCDTVASTKKELVPFLHKFDALVLQLEKETGFKFTDTGDGFMCVVDLRRGHNCDTAATVLTALSLFLKRMKHLIKALDLIGIIDFRIRISAGFVVRTVKKDGSIIHRGKLVNRTHNLLEFEKETGIIGHDSFKRLMNDKQIERAGFSTNKILLPTGDVGWVFNPSTTKGSV